ncbi:uncharacterized protein LOC129799776 [Phlebotomus papatasi]|uniref:Uncharacterized protein n=1 Tax=Phlebotomus papatasi TaxID=29031 RepID=A0A1B0CZK9_PHLPP|nr:uncharacterized protein LOC129799776 [Phlebotomus papatasi]
MDQSREKLLKPRRLFGISNEMTMEHEYPSVIYEEEDLTDINEMYSEDQAMPNYIFKPSSTITWADQQESYSSLPVEVEQINNVDECFEKFDRRIHSWEAEDADDFITTLDESILVDIQTLEDGHNIQDSTTMGTKVKNQRPKSLYDITSNSLVDSATNQIMVTSGGPVEKFPKIMTTSCYGVLNTGNEKRVKSNSEASLLLMKSQEELQIAPPLESYAILPHSTLWASSTDELRSSKSQQQSRDDILASLESSFCDSNSMSSSINFLGGPNKFSSSATVAIADIAELGESDIIA